MEYVETNDVQCATRTVSYSEFAAVLFFAVLRILPQGSAEFLAESNCRKS